MRGRLCFLGGPKKKKKGACFGPFSGRCGAIGAPPAHCNGHPTHREPGTSRLWVGGAAVPCFVPVSAINLRPGGPAVGPKGGTGALGGANNRALRHQQALYVALHHPQPTDGLWWAPCGSGGHCIGRKTAHGHHNSTKEAAAGQQPSSSALPMPRPGAAHVAPWSPQTPTNHPRGLAHHPCCLWGPLGWRGWRKRHSNMPVRVPAAWSSSGVRP